ncbi:hypothetical protein [Stenotrophomonas sp. PFBMAA-4]|nr:hypothetical protein [Stenotrophomonas sp. PFBMAA-4]MDI9274858.1 hypothetical protein [Stenotrophomonas sp. PFBMAA-4]
MNDTVTSAIGRHDVRKATDFLRGSKERIGVQGFWVTMPLLWGEWNG